MTQIQGPHQPVEPTLADYEDFAREMHAYLDAQLAALRHRVRVAGPCVEGPQLKGLFGATRYQAFLEIIEKALNANKIGVRFEFDAAENSPHYYRYLFALDSGLEAAALKIGYRIRAHADDTFTCTRDEVCGPVEPYGGVDYHFPSRAEALVYALGKHPEIKKLVAPTPPHVRAWQRQHCVSRADASTPDSELKTVVEDQKLKVGDDQALSFSIDKKQLTELGPNMLSVMHEAQYEAGRAAGVSAELLEKLRLRKEAVAGIGDRFMALVGPLLSEFTARVEAIGLTPSDKAELKKKVMPRMSKEMQELINFMSPPEVSFDPFGGGLPPGASAEDIGDVIPGDGDEDPPEDPKSGYRG